MEHLSDDDLRDLRRLLQQAALKDYPNPERKGCPGLKVLEEVADASAPFEHSAYEHIKTCSPCLSEMLGVRRQKIRVRRSASRKRQVAYGVFSASAAVLMVGIWLGRRHQPNPPNLHVVPSQQKGPTTVQSPLNTLAQAPKLVALDLSGLARTRGGEAARKIPEVRLPSAVLNLQITLPFGSDDGRYDLEIRKSDESRRLIETSGIARIEQGDTKLNIPRLDLSFLPRDRYVLSFRHADAAWQRTPILID